MILSEFGSTGIKKMSVFQALSAGNGMNPFRFAPGPVSIPAHVPVCAKVSLERENNKRPKRMMICRVFMEAFLLGGWNLLPVLEWHVNSPLLSNQSQQVHWRRSIRHSEFWRSSNDKLLGQGLFSPPRLAI